MKTAQLPVILCLPVRLARNYTSNLISMKRWPILNQNVHSEIMTERMPLCLNESVDVVHFLITAETKREREETPTRLNSPIQGDIRRVKPLVVKGASREYGSQR